MRTAILVGVVGVWGAVIARAQAAPAALADLPVPPPPVVPEPPVPTLLPQPIVGFVVRGTSKVKPRTLSYLSHTALGDLIGPEDIPKLEQALVSSELFEQLSVALEPAPGDPSPGWIVVATVTDKHSWIAAPTAFALPGNLALGAGYAENDFRGLAQKFLLYAQIGTTTSLMFATFLDPAVRGSQLTWRADLYAYQRQLDEYGNPPGDPGSSAVARSSTATYFSAAALIGWNFRWWLAADLRVRGAYVYFREAHDAAGQPVATPEKDGWDVTAQARLTIDHRQHRYGVTWGSFVQLHLEPNLPGLDSYSYQLATLRAYHSWRLFDDHELELRGIANAGRNIPLHEDMTLGGASDLRGYSLDQFRGDTRAVVRAEYSIPLYHWRFFAFRGIGFYDAGYTGFFRPRGDDRVYLPNQLTARYTRTDVGGGLRVYLRNIVLPLLGLDVGYGIEGHSPEVYFEVGLTDF